MINSNITRLLHLLHDWKHTDKVAKGELNSTDLVRAVFDAEEEIRHIYKCVSHSAAYSTAFDEYQKKRNIVRNFSWSNFNPDIMSEGELDQWGKHIGCGRHPQIAKVWFPKTKGMFKLARNAKHYCDNKLVALKLHASGNHETAKTYEEICDRIYTEFPDQLKWTRTKS